MKREPRIDFDHSVDRTYFTNRHQAQFIGQNLLAHFHFQMRDLHFTTYGIVKPDEVEGEESAMDEHRQVDKSLIETYERQHALCDDKNKLIDHQMSPYDFEDAKEPMLSYSEHLMKGEAGASLFRMKSAKDHFIDLVRICPTYKCQLSKIRNLIRYYNHLVFDFDTHQLVIERLSNGELSDRDSDSLLQDCLKTLQSSNSDVIPIEYYRVNIEQLAKETKDFNHASHRNSYPAVKIDHFSFLDYTHLSHVSLAVTESSEKVFVLATYGGIVAL